MIFGNVSPMVAFALNVVCESPIHRGTTGPHMGGSVGSGFEEITCFNTDDGLPLTLGSFRDVDFCGFDPRLCGYPVLQVHYVCHNSAIFRAVVPIIVDTVNGETFHPTVGEHPVGENIKGLNPLFTDANSPASVSVEHIRFGIETPLLHPSPDGTEGVSDSVGLVDVSVPRSPLSSVLRVSADDAVARAERFCLAYLGNTQSFHPFVLNSPIGEVVEVEPLFAELFKGFGVVSSGCNPYLCSAEQTIPHRVERVDLPPLGSGVSDFLIRFSVSLSHAEVLQQCKKQQA